jgi:hypothetical protein
MTADEMFAQCMQTGGDEPSCRDVVASQMVSGVFCDGQVVIDERGHRCIDQATLDRVARARAANPLPSHPVPSSGASAMPIVTVAGVKLSTIALVGAGVIVAWLVLRR